MSKFFLVKETGDVLKYVGETLTDPHKGLYDSYYTVVLGNRFKTGYEVCEFELHDKEYKYYSLVQLPSDIDIKSLNHETVKLLYGK